MRKNDQVSVQEVADFLGVSGTTVRHWVEEDGMPTAHSPHGTCVRRCDLRRFLLRKGLPVPPGLEPHPCILIVDDDEDLLEATRAFLQHVWPDGAVHVSRSGEQALRSLPDMHPDLLIADIYLPGRSGLDLCREVREDRSLEHTRVVAVTGHHHPGIASEALASGADEYLQKPFSPAGLMSTIVRLLGLVRFEPAGGPPEEGGSGS